MTDVVAEALRSTPVVDGHNDLPVALRARSGYSVEGLADGRPDLHTDLPRLRAGGVGAQFWSVYVSSELPEPEAVVATLEQIDAVYRLVARYPDALRIAYTAADVEKSFADGRIASLLGVEGGHSLAESPGVLRSYARLGVRYVTLTHNDNTSWADSATDEPGVGGLDDTGRAIVADLNRTGILVDLSHVAESTQRAALAASTAPVLFSHSSARALNDHPRNVTDPVLELLRDNGGVIQLTFVPYFISARVSAWAEELQAERERLGLAADAWRWPRAPRPGEDPAAVAEEHADLFDPSSDDRLSRWLEAHPRPEVTVAEVADHVEHARDVAGVDHVGLGGDYDGVDHQPAGLADVSGYPVLLGELAGRGWSRTELEALTGRNVLRVLRAAEEAATEPLWPTAPLR
ncbi:membrane dipeptidase [Streptomyces sp. 1222.5]|uniref:dipeptidase n=1 Tax=unclassified Streptomyces TaxID=2593676 RepID=UPI00089A53FB|nr:MULTISPECIES: dipeptidase [unclassified Streptomyces]PKW05655.1 membrane dipeptidase [Streptomyces sp. 5112.2]SEC24099.1 membrane dipeptidase [Streptomyces sp. 2231.1]SED32732.1 membrane dipeptidase [Streptomyces sp. 1222.5]